MADLSEREKLIERLEILRGFLNGTDELDGVCFGDWNRTPFWWRKELTWIYKTIRYLDAESERLAAVRNEAIEEGAKVAENQQNIYVDAVAAANIAATLRSLKEPQ